MRQTLFLHGNRILGLVLLGLVVASCAYTPASLVRDFKGNDSQSLGVLLEEALSDQESAESSRSLARFVEKWKLERGGARSGEITFQGKEGGIQRYSVSFESQHDFGYTLDYFDSISPAVDYRVKKMEHHRRDGFGAPLVAVRENRGHELEKYYPPEAITRPVTAVAQQGPMRNGVRQVKIELLCPLRDSTFKHGDKTAPLAADFSVPWAALLSKSGKLSGSRFFDTLKGSPSREPRLYLLEPYDPNKQPLIMIHGLFSTPLTWATLSNELWAVDEIRNRYQIWHYLYNTSAPALYSGRTLQAELRKLRQILDPTGRDKAMQSTTLIAHSMGGIVSRRLITEPGKVFWEAAFTKRFDDLKLEPDDRETLRRAFFWESESHIKRVIYIAVPHRGSDYADNILGRFGKLIVKPPSRFAAFYERISSANPGAFTPEYDALGRGKLDSVDALSPRQPTLKILSDLPNGHPVKEHSIIANRGKPGPLKDSTDGVVAYWSSHIDRAESEKIVPADHKAVDHPESIAEIVRILTSD